LPEPTAKNTTQKNEKINGFLRLGFLFRLGLQNSVAIAWTVLGINFKFIILHNNNNISFREPTKVIWSVGKTAFEQEKATKKMFLTAFSCARLTFSSLEGASRATEQPRETLEEPSGTLLTT